LTLQKLSQ